MFSPRKGEIGMNSRVETYSSLVNGYLLPSASSVLAQRITRGQLGAGTIVLVTIILLYFHRPPTADKNF